MMAEMDIPEALVERLEWFAREKDLPVCMEAAEEIRNLRALIIQIDKITIWDTVAGGRQLQEEIDSIRRRLAGT